MVAQLVHMWVVLGHNGDGIALLPDDEAGLLLSGVAQVDSIILIPKGNVIREIRSKKIRVGSQIECTCQME